MSAPGMASPMRIAFPFNLDKAIQSIAYLISRLGPIEKVKLMKLVYIADRNHFIRFGHPITGSNQVAMDYGPVPSPCLAALDGEGSNPDAVFQALHIENVTVSLHGNAPDLSSLDDQDRATLDQVVLQFGRAPAWDLVKHTHKFPEYEEVYVQGTSTPITYEAMLRHYGGDQGYRYNRPVVSEAMQTHMMSPFRPNSDADL